MNLKTSILAISLIGCALAALPEPHPLKHPNATVDIAPRSLRVAGAIPINEVIGYILGSQEEADAARRLLEAAGYGPNGEHYLYCEKDKAVADGKAFASNKEAVEHLVKSGVKVALYLTKDNAHPKTIPSDLTYTGLALRALDWHK